MDDKIAYIHPNSTLGLFLKAKRMIRMIIWLRNKPPDAASEYGRMYSL
jgi:hypothetical protein